MVRYISTRKTVRFGGSVYVCLDKAWGFEPDEMVVVTVERLGDGDGGTDDDLIARRD